MSRYEFVDKSDSFSILYDNKEIDVVLRDGISLTINYGHRDLPRQGLFDYRCLVEKVVSAIYEGWVPKKRPDNKRKGDIPQHKLLAWAKKRTGESIGRRFSTSWRSLIQKADPAALAVQRSLFAATGKAAHYDLLTDTSWYKNRFLVKDVTSYRAAAICLQYGNSFPSDFIISDDADRHDQRLVKFLQLTPDNFDKIWMRRYSYDGELYTSLTRTLMNFPGGVPPSLLKNLRLIRLKKPMTNRLPLTFMLATTEIATSRAGFLGREGLPNLNLMLEADSEAIKKVAVIVGNELGRPVNTRKTSDIVSLSRYLLDYPHLHTGSIKGLAEKSVEWHRQDRRLREKSLNYDKSVETAKTWIDVPENSGLKLLSSVGEILEEGDEMQHCVASDSYVRGAVEGEIYLFSFTHPSTEERATIEVSKEGSILQAQGPRNSKNQATIDGVKVLSSLIKKSEKNKEEILGSGEEQVSDVKDYLTIL